MDLLRKLASIAKTLIPKTKVAGTHEAEGVGVITGLHASRALEVKPDAVIRASGIGKVTGTKLE